MRRRVSPGMTLVELVLSVSLMGMVLGAALILFVSGKKYHVYGNMRVDSQTAARLAANRLIQDVQESGREGIRISASRNALLLISARDSQGRFQIYTGSEKSFQGGPYWQKWVMYDLEARAGSTSSFLMKREGNPYGSPLPNPDLSVVASSVPDRWESVFRDARVPARVVAPDIHTLDIEDIDCGSSGSPLYIQVLASRTFQGEKTQYNPGDAVSFSCSGKAGYWIGVTARN